MFFRDRRIIYVILVVLVVWTLTTYLSNPTQLLTLLLTLPGVIIAITFHEFAHAYVAYKLGDDTPKYQGRITLNPFEHIDPIGFFMLIFANFGWGKPVEINPRNFNRKMSMSAQEALVALAGPAMNIILAIILEIIICLIATLIPTFMINTPGYFVTLALQLAVNVNIGLGVFNLIPIPPLDGSKILMHFLPINAKNWFREHQNIFYIIFLVLWATNLLGYIIAPVINAVSNGIYGLVLGIFRIFIRTI